jgi:hypothetical protein
MVSFWVLHFYSEWLAEKFSPMGLAGWQQSHWISSHSGTQGIFVFYHNSQVVGTIPVLNHQSCVQIIYVFLFFGELSHLRGVIQD